MKITYLKGLQGSGKSYWALEEVKNSKGKMKRLNKDSIRLMLDAGIYSGKNESLVVGTERELAEKYLIIGFDVCIDNTGFNPMHEEFYRELAKKHGAEFEVKFFDVGVDECIKRDLHRGKEAVGEQVIRKLDRQYLHPVKKESRLLGKLLLEAAIFDIDGCLAINDGHRGHFDWGKVGDDSANVPVVNLAKILKDNGFKILVFSGRDSVCRNETMEWLDKHGVEYDELRMRKEGDVRKDVLVKKEFYDELKFDYEIIYAVDDRPQVAELWFQEGLCLLKVGDPYSQF